MSVYISSPIGSWVNQESFVSLNNLFPGELLLSCSQETRYDWWLCWGLAGLLRLPLPWWRQEVFWVSILLGWQVILAPDWFRLNYSEPWFRPFFIISRIKHVKVWEFKWSALAVWVRLCLNWQKKPYFCCFGFFFLDCFSGFYFLPRSGLTEWKSWAFTFQSSVLWKRGLVGLSTSMHDLLVFENFWSPQPISAKPDRPLSSLRCHKNRLPLGKAEQHGLIALVDVQVLQVTRPPWFSSPYKCSYRARIHRTWPTRRRGTRSPTAG